MKERDRLRVFTLEKLEEELNILYLRNSYLKY
jgi:hypothetical protein